MSQLGVAYSTFREYKKKYSALSAALKKGREVVDFEVENAMLKIALGFSKIEEQAIKCRDISYDERGKKCQSERVEIVEVEKYYPPNFNAQKHWLNNRKKDEWKNDPNKIEIDREALELRKKELEQKIW